MEVLSMGCQHKKRTEHREHREHRENGSPEHLVFWCVLMCFVVLQHPRGCHPAVARWASAHGRSWPLRGSSATTPPPPLGEFAPSASRWCAWAQDPHWRRCLESGMKLEDENKPWMHRWSVSTMVYRIFILIPRSAQIWKQTNWGDHSHPRLLEKYWRDKRRGYHSYLLIHASRNCK